MVLKGTTHDWEGYDKATKERWEKDAQYPAMHRCKVHKSVFYPDDEDGEPCWQCWHEFEIDLMRDENE